MDLVEAWPVNELHDEERNLAVDPRAVESDNSGVLGVAPLVGALFKAIQSSVAPSEAGRELKECDVPSFASTEILFG